MAQIKFIVLERLLGPLAQGNTQNPAAISEGYVEGFCQSLIGIFARCIYADQKLVKSQRGMEIILEVEVESGNGNSLNMFLKSCSN